MKLGYVSRVHPKDNYNHAVLTMQGYKPKEFSGQINLNVNNMWGILKVRFCYLCSLFWPVAVGCFGGYLRAIKHSYEVIHGTLLKCIEDLDIQASSLGHEILCRLLWICV